MPSGRPLKRPSDGDDCQIDGSMGAHKAKLARLDRGSEDFSSVVKSKLQSYTRTGQACDRCKVRKIRCDALPEGCSHCANQNLECYVTDRVTGRTERRGYMQQLEREKNDMVNRIRDLERLLDHNGIEVKPWQGLGSGAVYPPGVTFDNMGNPVQDPMSKEQWTQVDNVWVKNYQSRSPSHQADRYTRYSLLETRPTDSYLGVTSDNAPLSSMKGTTLSVLGATVDITSFAAPDIDEPPPGTPMGSPLYNKSVLAFLQSTMNINPPQNIELPSRQEAFTYAEWYFFTIFPFLPVLHKPTFLKLLTRIYDEPDFKATTSEMVMVHTVLAAIYFQFGIRNPEDTNKRAHYNELSNKHYHWCLSKFFDLACSQTVEAVQALVMIALHTRSFPKPGCSSTVANYAFSKAIEMNLHRAVKVENDVTNLDNEMRKRIWWVTLTLVVTLNGRLGRPMPITLEEFDVDFPMAIPDECLAEDGVLDPSRMGQCEYMVGIVGFKVVPLYMEMFSSIYSVRRDPRRYADVVRNLEEGMRSLEETMPDELKIEKCKPASQIYALYTQAFCLEFRLCLRHPSVCMTDDPKLLAENTRICEETARKLLKVVGALLKVRSLDTTWYQLSVYIAAAFSTLVAHWERRFNTTAFEIATLREEMALWLEIISEIGQLLGTGTGLTTDVSATIERTISWIEHDMNRKETTPPSHGRVKHKSTSPFQPPLVSKMSSNGTSSSSSVASTGQRNGTNTNGYYETVNDTTPYPALSFADQAAAAAAAAAGAPNNDTHGMSTTGSFDLNDNAQYIYASAAAAAAAANGNGVVDQGPSAQNPLVNFATQAAQHVPTTTQPGDDWRQTAAHPQLIAAAAAAAHVQSHNTWHHWTAAIADSQDRYSANALLTLGAGPRAGDAMAAGPGGMGDPGAGIAGLGVAGAVSASSHAGQWPLLLFHDGTGAVGGA